MRQVHSNDFLDRVTVQTRTLIGEDVLGETEQWKDVITLWASCAELDYDTIGQVGVIEMDNNQSEMVLVGMTFKGRRSFSQADTRFIWRKRIFRPIKVRHISRSDTQLTLVHAHEETTLIEDQN